MEISKRSRGVGRQGICEWNNLLARDWTGAAWIMFTCQRMNLLQRVFYEILSCSSMEWLHNGDMAGVQSLAAEDWQGVRHGMTKSEFGHHHLLPCCLLSTPIALSVSGQVHRVQGGIRCEMPSTFSTAISSFPCQCLQNFKDLRFCRGCALRSFGCAFKGIAQGSWGGGRGAWKVILIDSIEKSSGPFDRSSLRTTDSVHHAPKCTCKECTQLDANVTSPNNRVAAENPRSAGEGARIDGGRNCTSGSEGGHVCQVQSSFQVKVEMMKTYSTVRQGEQKFHCASSR